MQTLGSYPVTLTHVFRKGWEISRLKGGGKEDLENLVRDFEKTRGTGGPGKKCEGYSVEEK